MGKLWHKAFYGIQHLVAPEGMESVLKIQFEDDLTGLEVVQEEVSCMDDCFCSLWSALVQLTWCQECLYCLHNVAAVLAARRWMVHPTAIGLNPPSFFPSAPRDASKKKGRTALGVLPWRITLISDFRAVSKAGPPPCADAPIVSLRCCGERPPVPPAEPFGRTE